METKVCGLCNIEKSIDKFDFSFGNKTKKHVCKTCYGKRDRAKLKLDMLEAFNYKCSCCGETHPYFLSLDHINNDGAKQREIYNEQQMYRQARREGWPKDKYQCLCMSCNFAKGHFGMCPHKSGITTIMALDGLRSLAQGTGRTLVQNNQVGLDLGPSFRKRSTLDQATINSMVEAGKSSGMTQDQIDDMIKRLV